MLGVSGRPGYQGSLQETQALPRVAGFAEGFLSGEPRSAQRYSRHCILCRGSGRRQAGTLGIIMSLPRASPRHGVSRRRRSERRHIWAAVHSADGPAVRPSAQMPPVPRAPSLALGKGVDPQRNKSNPKTKKKYFFAEILVGPSAKGPCQAWAVGTDVFSADGPSWLSEG
jgi:hypothetical protein